MIENIIQKLGAKNIQLAVGASHVSSVSNAKEAGRFPASWFDAVEHLAKENGVECPRDLFNWKRAS